MTVVVRKIGGSVAVVIPRAVAREMELSEGTTLDISATDAAIVMRKQGRRPRRSLGRIVAQIKPSSYRRRTRDAAQGDGPVGKEIG
jgi:antitoxin component of MazEF toxin-antitoxin module